MDAFDPGEPAILHDQLSDTIITWTAEQADDFRRASRPGGDGTVIWKATFSTAGAICSAAEPPPTRIKHVAMHPARCCIATSHVATQQNALKCAPNLPLKEHHP
jgi:hypothetical protein